jgi:hypothetical protein
MHHQKPIRFKLIIEGEVNMGATVTGTYAISTGPGTTPPSTLAITPATGAEGPFPQGAAVPPTVLATVSGGTPPYSYAITDSASLFPQSTGYTLTEVPSADGITGDADITLGGTPNAADGTASPDTFTIVVTDSSTPAQSATFKRKL